MSNNIAPTRTNSSSKSNTTLPYHQTRRKQRYPQTYRINIPLLSHHHHYFTIRIPSTSITKSFISSFFESLGGIAMQCLGPILIIIVFALLFYLTNIFFTILLPLQFNDDYSIPIYTLDTNNNSTATATTSTSHEKLIISSSTTTTSTTNNFNLYFKYQAIIQEIFVIFIIFNIIYNYLLCICTSNKMNHPQYQHVVQELANVTNFHYPMTQEEILIWKDTYRKQIIQRLDERDKYYDNINNNIRSSNSSDMKGRYNDSSNSSSNSNSNNRDDNGNRPSWMILGPYDWGFCDKSKMPKPPRSHFDFVTKSLVLNMDHYCPWMFNVGKYIMMYDIGENVFYTNMLFFLLTHTIYINDTQVGYFNYRYFCNFLLYVFLGMLYGAIVSFPYFLKIDSHEYIQQISQCRNEYIQQYNKLTGNEQGVNAPNFHFSQITHVLPGIPIPSERMPICFAFTMCLALGIAVGGLFFFHLYLIMTCQTTIEFHGNRYKRLRAREDGHEWKNPYNFGLKRNLELVWGSIETKSTSSQFLYYDGKQEDMKERSSGFRRVLANSVYRFKLLVSFLMLLLPSRREPEFLPVPFEGDIGRRRKTISIAHNHVDTFIENASLTTDDTNSAENLV